MKMFKINSHISKRNNISTLHSQQIKSQLRLSPPIPNIHMCSLDFKERAKTSHSHFHMFHIHIHLKNTTAVNYHYHIWTPRVTMTENAIFLHIETQTLCSYECIFIFWEDEPGLKIDISLHKPPITPNRTHMVSRDPLPPFTHLTCMDKP